MQPNSEALARFARGDARIAGVVPARESILALASGRVLTHAGPPIAVERMCGPMLGALAGAAIFEGWAATPAEAEALLASGEIAVLPNHHAGAVAPMAGVISPSMMTFVVENPGFGNGVATIFNEGNVPDSLRCGANGPSVIERLRWLNGPVAASIAAALPPGLSIRDLIAEAVLRGDEMHQRNLAGTALFLGALLPQLREVAAESEAVRYLQSSSQFFLNLAMAASKAMLDPLSGIPGCSIVTAMSRNGVDFGIRVSAAGYRWFTAPATAPRAVWWDGFGPGDANPDIGDSAIVETAGLGGFALPGAPGLHPRIGTTPREAAAFQTALREITAGASPFYLADPAGGLGTPFGIEVLKVVETGIAPVITTGIAHRKGGVGQVGVGIVRPPLACFESAAAAVAALQPITPGR